MGTQNGMVTTVSTSIVRTTHLTGIATDAGLVLGRALHRALVSGKRPLMRDAERGQ